MELEKKLDDPWVIIFRRVMLETIARTENSELHCPKCGTNLPYNQMTVAQIPDGVDANLNPVYKDGNFCTLCEEYF